MQYQISTGKNNLVNCCTAPGSVIGVQITSSSRIGEVSHAQVYKIIAFTNKCRVEDEFAHLIAVINRNYTHLQCRLPAVHHRGFNLTATVTLREVYFIPRHLQTSKEKLKEITLLNIFLLMRRIS